MAGSEGWVLTLLVVIGCTLLRVKWRWITSATHRVNPKPSPRPLKPRTSDDCPACRATPNRAARRDQHPSNACEALKPGDLWFILDPLVI